MFRLPGLKPRVNSILSRVISFRGWHSRDVHVNTMVDLSRGWHPWLFKLDPGVIACQRFTLLAIGQHFYLGTICPYYKFVINSIFETRREARLCLMPNQFLDSSFPHLLKISHFPIISYPVTLSP